MHPHAHRLQCLRDEQSEFTVAQHGHIRAFRNPYLFKDLACCSKRLDKYRLFRRHRIWNDVEIRFGKSQKFPECARVANNTQHGALRAVPAKSFPAPVAPAARKVDLAGHTPPNKLGGICFNDLTDEFVPWCSAETIVAALQLDIGLTDPSTQEPDQCKTRRTRWFPRISNSDSTVLKVDRKHPRNYTTGMATALQYLWQQLGGGYFD